MSRYVKGMAVATARSLNRKVGAAAVTYAAQGSCPTDCAFLGAGCYAEGASAGLLTRKLNENAGGAGPWEIALAEAEAIDAIDPLYEGQPMRLHTVGDCATEQAARIVAAAAERWTARGGGRVWTYTHAWRVVSREAWGVVSVLASCETPLDVFQARVRDYATALVVDTFDQDGRYPIAGDGTLVELVPCPAQTRDVPCTDCGLCFYDRRRYDAGVTIGFAVHGDMASTRQARGVLRGERPVKLRDAIPRLLAEGMNGRQIAEATGTSPSSVYEMTARLRAEGVIP